MYIYIYVCVCVCVCVCVRAHSECDQKVLTVNLLFFKFK